MSVDVGVSAVVGVVVLVVVVCVVVVVVVVVFVSTALTSKQTHIEQVFVYLHDAYY